MIFQMAHCWAACQLRPLYEQVHSDFSAVLKFAAALLARGLQASILGRVPFRRHSGVFPLAAAAQLCGARAKCAAIFAAFNILLTINCSRHAHECINWLCLNNIYGDF
jgi:hypothetical protein